MLKGDLQAGFFGIVSADELFGNAELTANVELTTGTFAGGPGDWFKFAYKGKFLYFACRQLRINVTWNDLYNLGLVYGTKDNGTYPVGAGATQWRPQRKVENGRSWFLIPRLPRVAVTDPANLLAPVTDQVECEWYQLFRRMFSNSGGPSDRWYSATAADVFFSGYIGDWMLNTRTDDVNHALFVGTGASNAVQTVTSRNKGTLGVNPFWRPVLELIPVGSVMDPWRVGDQSYGTLPPAITQNNVSSLGVASVKNAFNAWSTQPPIISNYSYPLAVNPVAKPRGSADLGLVAFSVTGAAANLANPPRNLVYQSSNLNPFSVSGSNIA
jgi:hypothetical protein